MPNLQLNLNVPVKSKRGDTAGWSNVDILPLWPPPPPPPPPRQAVTTGFVVNQEGTPYARVSLVVGYGDETGGMFTELIDRIEFSIIAEGSAATDPPFSSAVVNANLIALNRGASVVYEVALTYPVDQGTTYTLNIKIYGNYE
ncbi:hypothetical protein JXB37_08220 [candidate division WOR-3 bacterium]|nr:hypothetical protein [candidate division WOR-3 bacterium]